MNVKGEYFFEIPVQNMFIDRRLRIAGENIITQLGECFMMNRWVNDNEDVIQYLVLGKGTKRPTKNDLELARETVRKPVSYEVQAKRNCLELSANFRADEVIDTSEIGLHTGSKLITHDLYKEITRDVIIGDMATTVNLLYRLTLMSGSYRSGWKPVEGGVYFIYEPVQVLGVYEANTDSGYSKKSSVDELVAGTYFYDSKSRTLYIKTTNGSDPNFDEIIVET